MSKRSTKFERRPRDFYPTPVEAIPALAEHLPRKFTFAEPCAGDGTLIRHLEEIGGRCVAAYDIAPGRRGILKRDALTLGYQEMNGAGFVVTNPPWARPVLHALIDHFADYSGPVWFLFDADWWLTVQAAPYLKFVRKIVAVGRLRWIPGSKHTGFDNVAWYQIGRASATPMRAFGRVSSCS